MGLIVFESKVSGDMRDLGEIFFHVGYLKEYIGFIVLSFLMDPFWMVLF
jgi:hypothetical protein